MSLVAGLLFNGTTVYEGPAMTEDARELGRAPAAMSEHVVTVAKLNRTSCNSAALRARAWP